MKKIARNICAVTVAFLCGSSLSGCGGPEQARGFDVPALLCDIPVPRGPLGDVLPGTGEKISTQMTSDRYDNARFCRVLVDGEVAVSASIEWRKKGTTVAEVAAGQIGVDLDEHVSSDEKYAYGDEGAASRVECPKPRATHRIETSDLFVTIFITSKGTPNESAMKELINSYAQSVSKSEQCTQ